MPSDQAFVILIIKRHTEAVCMILTFQMLP